MRYASCGLITSKGYIDNCPYYGQAKREKLYQHVTKDCKKQSLSEKLDWHCGLNFKPGLENGSLLVIEEYVR